MRQISVKEASDKRQLSVSDPVNTRPLSVNLRLERVTCVRESVNSSWREICDGNGYGWAVSDWPDWL